MKLAVGQLNSSDPNYYFITDAKNGKYAWNDREIMKYLNLPPHEFYSILSRHNGLYDYENYIYLFKDKSDIENVIEELSPILIMSQLIK